MAKRGGRNRVEIYIEHMNLYAQRSSNIRRTWALVLGFLIVVIAVGYAVSAYYGNPFILYIAIVIAVATNFYAYWYSDKLVLSLSNARTASREEFLISIPSPRISPSRRDCRNRSSM